jgi:hypothetical protein
MMGLRDKVVFLAARSEQYVPAMVFFAGLGLVDMIVALKALDRDGVGRCRRVEDRSPFLTGRVADDRQHAADPVEAKRMNYRHFPDDKVADAVDQLTWRPNGPIPLQVNWTRRRGDEPIDTTDAMVATVAHDRSPAGTRAV